MVCGLIDQLGGLYLCSFATGDFIKKVKSKTKLVFASVIQQNMYWQRDLCVSPHMHYIVYEIQLHMEFVASVEDLGTI